MLVAIGPGGTVIIATTYFAVWRQAGHCASGVGAFCALGHPAVFAGPAAALRNRVALKCVAVANA